MQDFKNLVVWQKAHELALFTYTITADFPREELFGLRNTLRKTAVDIPACIAEGCGKETGAEFARLIGASIALGNRLEYYAIMACDLNLLAAGVHTDFELLSGLSRKVERP